MFKIFHRMQRFSYLTMKFNFESIHEIKTGDLLQKFQYEKDPFSLHFDMNLTKSHFPDEWFS